MNKLFFRLIFALTILMCAAYTLDRLGSMFGFFQDDTASSTPEPVLMVEKEPSQNRQIKQKALPEAPKPIKKKISSNCSPYIETQIEEQMRKGTRKAFNEALLMTSYCNKVDIMDILVHKKQADVNYRNGNGVNAIRIATARNNPEAVRFLLKNGIDLNRKSRPTLLERAVYFGSLDVAKVLVKEGIHLNVWDHQIVPYERQASIGKNHFGDKGQDNVVRYLDDVITRRILDKIVLLSTDPNHNKPKLRRFVTTKPGVITDRYSNLIWTHKDNNRNINWHKALIYQKGYRGGGYTDWRLPTIKELETLYEAQKTNPYGLHISSAIGLTSYSAWSIEEKQNKAARYRFTDGKKVWYRKQIGDAGRVLLVRGTLNIDKKYKDTRPTINWRDINGQSYLHWAARKGRVNLINSLLKNGAKIEIKNVWGDSPLHWAARYNQPESIRTLIKNGAKVDSINLSRQTPIYFTIRHAYVESATVLLKNGTNVNHKDRSGSTPLHLISKASLDRHRKKYQLPYVKLLLKHGANLNVKNRQGKTPAMLAKQRKNSQLEKYFQSVL